MKKKGVILTFVGILALALVFVGVSGFETNAQKHGSQGLTLVADSLFPFDVAELKPSNMPLDDAFYTGRLNTTEVTLYVSDGNLFFVVPELKPGNAQLHVFIKGTTFTLDVVLKEAAS